MIRLLKFLRKYWWQIVLLFLGLFGQVWASLQLPSRMATIVNGGIVGGDQGLIWSEGGWMILTTLIGGCGMVVAGFFASRIGTGFAKDVREAIFKKVLSFSITEIDKFSTASLITRTTNDVNQMQQAVVMVLRMSCQAPIMGIGAIMKVLTEAPSMGWIIAVAVGVLLTIMITLVIFVLPKFRIVQKLTDRLSQVMRENLTGLRVVRAFNNEKQAEKKFEGANQDLNKVNLFVGRAMAIMSPVIGLVMNFTMLLVIWVGAKNIDAGSVEIGNVLAFLQYAMQVMMSFMFLTMAFIIVPRAMVSWKRIEEVLGTKNSIRWREDSLEKVEKETATVQFKNVCFGYPGAEDLVLKNVSFTAKAGETTAFIGSTGSGKSTLINLVPRFYDASEGEVLVNGMNVKDYAEDDLMEKIGYVPQRGVLFSGTVESNVGFGMKKIDKKQVKQSLVVAQAEDFVEKLEGKLGARIAQGGGNVSGGQKQRLSIARAIAKDPEIYIFDDSFSALDFKTDAKLREALKQVTGDAAVLIVAQRIGTIKHAEQIVVLDKGKVAGKGTHSELMRTCAIYREIAASQLSEMEMEEELKQAQVKSPRKNSEKNQKKRGAKGGENGKR